MRNYAAAALAAAFVLSCSSAALADTTGLVRGTVTLAGKAAAGATVTLSGEGAPIATTTDAKGSFSIPRVPFGHYTITVHAEGASADFSRDIDVRIDAILDVPVRLSSLKEIGRTAVSSAAGAGGLPVSVNTITRRQIAALPDDESLDRVVETMPGIVRFSYNEPVAHGFHGLTYELDGVPLPQATTANFGEIIDPRTIDSLEVFTGAFPAEYGGYRQGAVVNIISNRASDLTAPERGQIYGGLANYGGAEAGLSESFTVGKNTRVFFDTNQERTSRGIDAPTFVPVHDNSNTSNEFLRTITNLGPHDTLAFDATNSYQSFQIPINPTFNVNDPVINAPGQDDVQGEYSRNINLVYTHNTADGTGYTQIAPWYRYDRVAYLGDLPADEAGYVDNGPGQAPTPLDGLVQDRHSQFTGIRLTQFRSYGANALKVGVDGDLENFAGTDLIAQPGISDYFTAKAQRGTLFSAYVEDKWTPTSYFSVNAGGRFDHSTGYVAGAQLSPRIEINGQVDPQDILHFYYGRLYAAPFLEDTRAEAVVTTGVTPTGSTGLPTYDLKPEHDSYYEFGLAHQLTPDVRSYVNFWKRDVNDVLDTTQIFPTPIFAVYNNTIGIAKGVEGRIDGTFHNGDSMFFSTTFSQSLAGGISGGLFLFCPPPTTAGCVAANQDVTLQPEDHDQTFEFNTDYTHRFGYRREYFASIEPEYGTGYPVQFQNGSGRLPPHLTFDASIGLDAQHGAHPRPGFVADFVNVTNDAYLIKVNNGFNTTQWGEGFRAGFRIVEPI